MGRFWSLLFLLVPIIGVWLIVAPAMDLWPFSGGAMSFPTGHWLPENINPDGAIVDSLFMAIFYLTGPIFIGTGIALFWFMWKYDGDKNTEPVKFTHGDHTLEVVWSVLPAVTLLFLAIYQLDAWADRKMKRPMTPGDDGIVGTDDDQLKKPTALITGRQFQWEIRYPGGDDELFTSDDLVTNTELHVPANEEVVLQIESRDVLHSFFLPNLRVKQDVVPGMTQYVWFKAEKEGIYDIVCAELCGWGHYKMRGRLVVESQSKHEQWMDELERELTRESFVAQVNE